jgi:predicted PurR-regulated permease PerM
VYVVVQFTQFYIIQPLLLGGEVNVNPLFAITVLILGEMVWGLGGMIMAIPLTGMIKIICDNVEELHPYGYLLGKSSEYRGSIFTKIRKWISGK